MSDRRPPLDMDGPADLPAHVAERERPEGTTSGCHQGRVKPKRVYEWICQYCNMPFKTTEYSQRYCKRSHRQRAYEQRKAERDAQTENAPQV